MGYSPTSTSFPLGNAFNPHGRNRVGGSGPHDRGYEVCGRTMSQRCMYHNFVLILVVHGKQMVMVSTEIRDTLSCGRSSHVGHCSPRPTRRTPEVMENGPTERQHDFAPCQMQYTALVMCASPWRLCPIYCTHPGIEGLKNEWCMECHSCATCYTSPRTPQVELCFHLRRPAKHIPAKGSPQRAARDDSENRLNMHSWLLKSNRQGESGERTPRKHDVRKAHEVATTDHGGAPKES